MDIQIEKGVQQPTAQDPLTQAILGMSAGQSFWVPDDEVVEASTAGVKAHDESKWQFGGRGGLNLCRYIEEKAIAVGKSVTCHVEVKDSKDGVRCFM